MNVGVAGQRAERVVKVDRHDTVVIGGGQAGLAVGQQLAERGCDFVILDALDRVGDSWRRHYDSLRLYNPAKMSSLPGRTFPGPPDRFPTRDEVAAYLEGYASAFDLPIEPGVRVERVEPRDGGYLVVAGDRSIEAQNVVVATGTFGRAWVPPFASDLDDDTLQLHSSEYRAPSQLRPGAVLVVGASHSGADVANDLAGGHTVMLAGNIHGEVPFDIEGRAAKLLWPVLGFVARHVLTIRTPMGRKARPDIRAHGGPLLRYRSDDLSRKGVELLGERVTGVIEGRPVLESGRVLDVANVVWCTGFRQDFTWIRLPILAEDGWPRERRGVVEDSPGLYFVGLAFQDSFSSMLLLGVGRDARYVVAHIDKHRSARSVGAR